MLGIRLCWALWAVLRDSNFIPYALRSHWKVWNRGVMWSDYELGCPSGDCEVNRLQREQGKARGWEGTCFSNPTEHIQGRLCMRVCLPSPYSCVWLFVTLWVIACQSPLPMGFSRQEYWSGLPWPPPGDLPDPGIETASLNFSHIGRQVLYHWCHLENPICMHYSHCSFITAVCIITLQCVLSRSV